MRKHSKIPKTFIISLKYKDRSGYLRYRSHETHNNISFGVDIEKYKKNASVFINFDNVRKTAASLMENYDFDDVKIIDTKTNRVHKIYYAKKTKKQKPEQEV